MRGPWFNDLEPGPFDHFDPLHFLCSRPNGELPSRDLRLCPVTLKVNSFVGPDLFVSYAERSDRPLKAKCAK